MASTDAIINLIVNGQQRVERIISRTNQLNELVQSINRSPLDLTIGTGSQNARDLDQIQRRLRGTREAIANTRQSIRQADAAMGSFGASAAQAQAELQNLSLGTIAYSRATRRLRNAEAGFNRQREAIADLNAGLEQLQRRERAERGQERRAQAFRSQIRFANELADTYLDVGTAARRLSGEINNITSRRSRAVLQTEIQFFDALASNVDMASESYRRFTAASGVASVAAGEASRRRFRILAETFDPEVRATTAQGRIPSNLSRGADSQAAREVQSLINAFPEVARSKSGLEDYRAQLQSVLDLIPAGTTRFIQLSSAIRQVDDELFRFREPSGRQFGPSQFIDTPASGPTSDIFNSLKQRQQYADAVNKQYQKQEDLIFKIGDSALEASRKESLSLQVNTALDALMENRLEVAKEITREVERQVNAESKAINRERSAGITTEKIDNARKKLESAAKRIETSAEGELINEVQKKNLLLQLDEARLEIDQKRLTVAQTIVAETDRQRRLEEIGNRAKFVRSRGSSFAADPIEGPLKLRQKYASDVNEEYQKQLDLVDRISKSDLELAKKENLSIRAAQALEALMENRLEIAQEITKEVDRQFKLEQKQAKSSTVVERTANRIIRGGESLPIDTPRRLKNKLASGAIVEQGLINLQAKGVNVTEQLISLQETLNDAKRDDFQISERTLGNLEEQVTLAGKRVTLENRRLAGKGGGGDSQQIEDLQEALRNRRFGPIARATNEELEELARRLQDIRNKADATGDEFRRLGRDLAVIGREQERRDPGAEFLTRRVGPRTGRAISEGLVGGAFPLLFGQGVGSSILGGLGGAAGGFAGGGLGFGLSLLGTAGGQVVDNFINSIKTLGESLKDPAQTLTALEEAGFAVDDSVKKTVEQLLEANKVYEAQAVALQQITDTLGPGSVELLNAYEQETKKLNTEYQKISATLIGELLPALVGTVAIVNDVVAAFKEFQKFQIPEAFVNFLTFTNPSFALARAQYGFVVDRGQQAAEEAGRPDLPDNPAATEVAQKARETADQLERQAATLRDQIRLAELNGDLTDERVFNLRKSIIFQEAALKLAEDGLTTEQRAVFELERKLKLQNLLNERVNEENRARERAAREAEQAAKKEEQTLRTLAQLSIAAIDTAVKTAEIDQGRLAAIQRELNLLERRKQFEEESILLSGEDARIQQFKFNTLDQEYRNKERLLQLERARLTLSKEQQTINATRAQRGQLESIQQESFGFAAQINDPFNTNPERLRAFEAEARSFQLVRAEREKLADLEREAASISPFASAEEVQKLAQQIDNQKAFIPALEAELALRNQLAAAASEQSAIIEKYGFLANELSTAMSTAVQAVVTGTGTVEEAFATMFQNIGRAFIDMATQMLAQKLFMTVLGALGGGSGFNFAGGSAASGLSAANLMGGTGPLDAGMFGFRANGGPVNANEPYIVGERGPELFMPSISGSITSNENLQAQNRAFLDSIYTENGETASDDNEAEREATAATRDAVRETELEATAATQAAVRESERIQENRMQVMSQQKESDQRYENERIQENRMQVMSQQKESDRRYENERIQENRMQIMLQQKESDSRYENERIRENRMQVMSQQAVATQAAVRESERIQENRMQIMSQQKEFDRRYERERIEQMVSTPGRLNIKYESQVINSVEYVSAEEHRRGMAQAAERGRALTLQALQNSVKTRSRVGI